MHSMLINTSGSGGMPPRKLMNNPLRLNLREFQGHSHAYYISYVLDQLNVIAIAIV